MTGKLQRSLSGYHVSDVCFYVKITLIRYHRQFRNSHWQARSVRVIVVLMSFAVLQATTGTTVESSINSFLHGIMSGDNSTMEELIKRFVSS